MLANRPASAIVAILGFRASRKPPMARAPRAISGFSLAKSIARTATLVQSADRGVGSRYAIDEHTFNPIRARVKADRWLTFVNNGSEAHTIAALDGSFTVQTLKTAESDSVKLLRPGTVRYACKEHPWAVGELTVEQ